MGKTKRKISKKTATPTNSPFYRNLAIIIAILAICTYLLYGASHKFGYTFDDDVYTSKNLITEQGTDKLGDIFGKGSVYGFSGENSGTYRPFTLFTFALEKNPRKPFDPQRSHRVQVFLYLLTVIGFYLLLRELFPDKPIGFAVAIALLFLAHPIHTEVVGNVKSRDEILALLFSVFGLWSLMKAQKSDSKLWLIGSGISFFLGCLSKETAVTMVAIAPLTLYIFSQKNLKEVAIQSIPVWAAGLLYLIIRGIVLDPSTANIVTDPYINNSILAAGSTGERIASNFLLLGKYISLLIFPKTLSYDYSFQQLPIIGWNNAQAWISLLAYLGLIAGGIYGVMKKSPWGYLALFYIITISIVSHFIIPIAATLGERFLFMPSIAFCIGLGLGLWWLGEKFGKALPFNPAYAALGMIFLVYSIKTYTHLPVWQSNDTLFEHGVTVAPNSFRTHLNLAEIKRAQGEAIQDANQRKPIFEKAIEHYRITLGIYGNNPTTWYNLGVCFYAINNTHDAIWAYQEALKLDPENFNAANNLGVIFFQTNDYDKAMRYFSQALIGKPNFADGHANIGAIFHNQGNFGEAISHYEQALAIDPNKRNVLNNLANIYQTLGNAEKANEYARRSNAVR